MYRRVRQREKMIVKWILLRPSEAGGGGDHSGLGVLTFCSVSDKAIALWAIEHRLFANDNYAKNKESVKAV